MLQYLQLLRHVRDQGVRKADRTGTGTRSVFGYQMRFDLAQGDFIWTGGDTHLYVNHLDQADEQLTRQPFPLPQLALRRKPPSIFEYEYEDFQILNYQAHPNIKAPIAV